MTGPTGPLAGLAAYAMYYAKIDQTVNYDSSGSYGLIEFQQNSPTGPAGHQNINIGSFTAVVGDTVNDLITGIEVPLDGYYKITSYVNSGSFSVSVGLVKNCNIATQPISVTSPVTTAMTSTFTKIDPGVASTSSGTLYNESVVFLTATDVLSLINISTISNLSIDSSLTSLTGTSNERASVSAAIVIEYLGNGS